MALSRLSFQAPELIVRGGEALARGIANGGQSLGAGLQQLFARQQQQQEQLKQRGDLAQALRKTLSIAYPDRSKEFAALGLPDLQGVLEGEAMKSAQAKQREAAATADAMARFTQSAARPVVENYYENPERFSAPPNIAMAALDNPQAANHPQFAHLAKTLSNEDLPGNISSYEDAVTGARFVGRGNNFMPAGYNPAKVFNVTVNDPNTGLPVEIPINPKSGQALMTPRPQKENRVSPEFTKSLGELAIGIDDPKNGSRIRGGVKAMIDTAHTLRQLDDEQRTALYKQFGIAAEGSQPAASTATPTAQERVTVIDPQGRRGSIPKSQLQKALSQGYRAQ